MASDQGMEKERRREEEKNRRRTWSWALRACHGGTAAHAWSWWRQAKTKP
jgi:hypothetical protein